MAADTALMVPPGVGANTPSREVLTRLPLETGIPLKKFTVDGLPETGYGGSGLVSQ
jgi:hypothetical protein